MAEIRQDLKLQSDPSTIVRPNIITDCIPDGAITAAKIAYYSIGHSWLAEDAVQDDNILDNAVITSKINSNAVTSSKIASGAVTEDKIGSGAVTNSKIGAFAVHRGNVRLLSQLVLDADTGEDFDDLLDWIQNAVLNGYRFYFQDSLGNVAQCLVVREGQEFRISTPSPLQGFNNTYTIDSANVDSFFGTGGAGESFCFVGLGE